MEDELPYRAEYAKSGRSNCRGCRSTIAKDTLRLAVMVQSPVYDGKMAHWYHVSCFFRNQRPKTVGDVAHFDALRWEDQETLKKKIGSASAAPSSTSTGKSKATKRKAPNLKEFSVEYSKSSRATCRGCEEKIIKDEVRISKKDHDSDAGRRYGGVDAWHHVECFAKLRDELAFWESGGDLPGVKTLTKEDQQMVKEKLPKVQPNPVKDEADGPSASKQMKTEPEMPKDEKNRKKQNDLMFMYRDHLKNAHFTRTQLGRLLEYNDQKIPEGTDRILDRLADTMTFGKLLPCSQCKTGQFVFRTGVGYQCLGSLTEWTRCTNVTMDPPRGPFQVPEDMRDKYDFLANYKYKPRKRIIHINPASEMSSTVTSQLPNFLMKSEPGKSMPKVYRPPPPMKNMEIVILGKTTKSKEELKEDILKMGGKVTTKIHPMIFAAIASQEEVDRMGKKMEQVKDLDINVVSEDFISEIQAGEPPLSVIKKKTISSWGGDASKRISQVSEYGKSGSGLGSRFQKSGGKVKLTVKNGVAVDPDSNLEDIAHVYRKGDEIFNVVLGLTDIQSGRNSFYKLQILEADNGSRFWVFRSWGRIGTTIGGTKVEKMNSLMDAKKLFKEHFLDKSGNHWESRNNFAKVPGKMVIMEIDYGGDDKGNLLDAESEVQSKLHSSVQDLIRSIFDIENMKKCMMEFELDLDKMPLGKLSQKQILEAYKILREALSLVQDNEKKDVKPADLYITLVDLSNRFYTFIPHVYGTENPPILNNESIIQSKLEMLDSLLEIEIAYNMLSVDTKSGMHPVDAQYEKLKADIELLHKESEEFELLQKYVKNTHAATHNQYDLEIEEIFKVRRHGEDRRYKPFKKLQNRKLLWHGSRLTNYAGILSQGLRIAPPEAPVTGYMFGKGIYFADMVSKSANYCMTSRRNPTGYMLLCEVALGNMYERTRADYIETLPKGMHSCKGIGKTAPNPAASVKTSDGVEVPLGEGVTDVDTDTTLLYNEYIVYDVAQVKFQYLFKMKFHYKV